MRSTSFSRNHPYAKTRGWVSGKRAAPGLPRITDGTNEIDDASELWFDGGTVDEPEDGVARFRFGGLAGGSNSGTASSASTPVRMFNSSGLALIPGDVVVVDPNVDSAVTTTATASNTLIAGVVQEPIDAATFGPVLFNGFASVVNTTGTVSRGNYALTSATAKLAGATAARVAGSFAVYLTGTDLPDFTSASITTEQESQVESLEITMPPSIPAGRVLFLALWLVSGTSSIAIDGWTRIGAESGYYYFYKVSEGDDTAEATWTTPSVAVATVLLLHESVSLAVPYEDHDYDSTTAAAAVASLDTAIAHYALAGVQATATPGSGYVRLGGGSAGFSSSGTPALVQSKGGLSEPSGLSFDANVTAGNVVVAIPIENNTGDAYATDPRQGGTCPPDSNMVQMVRNICTNTTAGHGDGNDALGIQAKVSGDTYAGPYSTGSACASNEGWLTLLEFENIGVSAYETLTVHGGTGTTINCGTFASTAATDIVIMAIAWKSSSSDPGVSVGGFTQITDQIVHGGTWGWVGYKIGNGVASVTASAAPNGWVAAAIKLTQGSQSVAGTLAGKYNAHVATATSPFTGAGAQNDAIIAFNLLSDAKASALLYGPDLGATAVTEPAADAHIADTSDAHDASAISVVDAGAYFTGTDVEAALQELGADVASAGVGGGFDVTPSLSSLLPPFVKPSASGVITADPQGRVTIDSGTGYKAFPGMAFLEGRLHLVYRDGTQHISAGGVIKYRTSDDLGRTWSSATTIATPGGSDDNRDPNITALSSGRLLLSYFRYNSTALDVRIRYSDNRGITWSSEYTVPDTFTGEAACAGPAIELPNGTILLPGYGNASGVPRYTAVVWSSTDGGLTFGNQVTVATDGTLSLDEITVRYLASGKIVALIREETTGDTYRSVSTDLGATWSAEAMVLDNSVAGRPDFVEFFPSALLWFGRGTSFASRWAVSWDEGATWTAVQETDSGVTDDSEYHAPVALAPGYVAVAYSIENSSTDADLYIRWYYDGYGTDPLGQIRADWLQVDEQAQPATPPSGKGVFYAGTDSKPYYLNDSGTATDLTAVSGSAGGDLSGTYPNPSVVDDSHAHTSLSITGLVGELLISDTPSTPLVFADILQNEAEDDFLYSDV